MVRKNQSSLKVIDVFDNFDHYLEVPPSSSIDELKEVIISERRQENHGHFGKDQDLAARSPSFSNSGIQWLRLSRRSSEADTTL